MSLTDAFLLESYPNQVWIENRRDGLKGSGTRSDPNDGSTLARFDEVMKSLPTDRPIRVQLGATDGSRNPFVTGGF